MISSESRFPLLGIMRLPKHGDDAMQRFRRGRAVLIHGDADVVRAGIAAVGLLAREIAPGHHAHAGLLPKTLGHDLAAAVAGDVEP